MMGERYPSVTTILKACGLGADLDGVPEAIIDRARLRGHDVHALIEADHYGYLDPAEIAPETAPYFAAYKRFVVESGHEAVLSEVEVIHEPWRYLGHMDRVGWLCGARIIIDWKTGEVPALRVAARQLAAYRLAWNHMHPDQPVVTVAVVQLRRDGSHRFYEIEIGERERREREFLAALTVYHAREEDRSA